MNVSSTKSGSSFALLTPVNRLSLKIAAELHDLISDVPYGAHKVTSMLCVVPTR